VFTYSSRPAKDSAGRLSSDIIIKPAIITLLLLFGQSHFPRYGAGYIGHPLLVPAVYGSRLPRRAPWRRWSSPKGAYWPPSCATPPVPVQSFRHIIKGAHQVANVLVGRLRRCARFKSPEAMDLAASLSTRSAASKTFRQKTMPRK